MLLFYLTPVFYKVDGVLPGYEIIAVLNPLANLIQSYRDIFFDGVMPPLARLGGTTLSSVIVAVSGYLVYRGLHRDLVDIA
jgi:ABC-type polysaccharide/polyol phosphate export permease